MSEEAKINTLGKAAAYQLADVTKTKPQFGLLTPKWLTRFLEFKGLDAGIYRVNRVKEGDTPLEVLCSSKPKSDIIPQGFVDYEAKPREYILNSISTIINVNTQVADVFSSPYDQTKEQLALAVESLSSFFFIFPILQFFHPDLVGIRPDYPKPGNLLNVLELVIYRVLAV